MEKTVKVCDICGDEMKTPEQGFKVWEEEEVFHISRNEDGVIDVTVKYKDVCGQKEVVEELSRFLSPPRDEKLTPLKPMAVPIEVDYEGDIPF